MKPWFARNWPWLLLLAFAFVFGFLQWRDRNFLIATWWSVPRWAFAVTFIGLPLANDGVRLSNWTAGQSLLHAGIRMLIRMFGAVPILGDFLKAMDQQAPDTTPKNGDQGGGGA